MRRALTVVLMVSLLAGAMPLSARAEEPVRERGYLDLSDGTRLHYDVMRPAGEEEVPVLLLYGGYRGVLAGPFPRIFTDSGYAMIHVSVRGSGCSEGTWSFLSEQEGRDGYEVIDWIVEQPWSNGRVAAMGESYYAITQFNLAATKHPNLVAIAPAHPVWDIYRDALYPGGIYNVGLATTFTGMQNFFSTEGLPFGIQYESEANRADCATNQAHRPTNLQNALMPTSRTAPFDEGDQDWRRRSPRYLAKLIDIPVWTMMTWQDHILGSRPIEMLKEMDAPLYASLSDGFHSMYWYNPWLPDLIRFLDHYVKGEENGYEQTPRIRMFWEPHKVGDFVYEPSWVTEAGQWPLPQARPMTLALGPEGTLEAPGHPGSGHGDEPGPSGADAYPYVPGTGQSRMTFTQGPSASAHLAYTSAPLEQDIVAVGSASLDLWLSSTAIDTDVQATLTDLRPDGTEVLVQQGWLRASHRAVDETLSTATQPYHPHTSASVEPMIPGTPELMRLEILPFGHVFRDGSRLRIYVEAPETVAEPVNNADGWAFEAFPTPAVNRVHYGGDTPSALVLSIVPGQQTDTPPPACGVVPNQRCR